MNLKEIRSSIDRAKGARDEIESSIHSLTEEISILKKEITYSEKAQVIIQTVAKETQQELEYHISDIVTLALETIFDDPYTFGLEFVLKRNKTECNLYLEKNGERIKPLDAAGGGVVDVVAFSLKIALWTLQQPRSRNCMVLDEPFKFLSKDLLPRASELLKELSEKLNLQFIMVTHLDELTDCADKTFNVKIKKGVSQIK